MSLLSKIHGLNQKQLFQITVVYPLALVLVYLHVFMPDRYQSSAVMLVKDSGQVVQAQTGLLASLGVESSGASEDMKLLQAFVQSKSLALALDRTLALREHYGSSWDFIFGISKDVSNERYFDFYKKHIQVKREIDTGLLEISVEAFSPEKAMEIIDEILKKSEGFVNKSSRSIAESEMNFAKSEINLSQKKLKQTKSALLDFQNRHGVVNPEGEGESLLNIVFELEASLAKTEADLNQARSYLGPNAPKLKALKTRVKALENEIVQRKKRVAGGAKGAELNVLSAEYQNLLLDVELAQTLYTGALSSFELARVQAGKQLKHLVIAAKPERSVEPSSPRRLYWLLTLTILALFLYASIRVVVISTLEHKD